ncbi:hypothetical protein MACH09_35450 [Vibrio sp. MACH09]|uniref:hypothetical protein n=1 Tax=Vibrio sp. MACH09 TaxID=3025122 RepID=UPI00278E9B30|nr:hypothetical protein [Vibrio sp. MACH09]GLO63037.1 hypothetical protein MACH09_35450 [Vibrio sp. MACH09]
MKQRFELLLQTQVISQRAYDGCLRVLQLLDDELGVPHDNEQYQMVLTHLARAADRIWQNNTIAQGLDADILQEIYDDDFKRTSLLHQKTLKRMGLESVSEQEESYMLANIYSLCQLTLSASTLESL